MLLSGCHVGDCHYIDANTYAEKRFNRIQKIMKQNGLDEDRMALVWVSAAEGQRFQDKINELVKKLKTVTPEEIEKSRKF